MIAMWGNNSTEMSWTTGDLVLDYSNCVISIQPKPEVRNYRMSNEEWLNNRIQELRDCWKER